MASTDPKLWCVRCIKRTIRGVATVELTYDPGRERQQLVDLIALIFDVASTPLAPRLPTVRAQDIMRGWPADTAIETIGRGAALRAAGR